MKKIYILAIIVFIIILVIQISNYSKNLTKEKNLKRFYSDINQTSERETINENTLPLIEDYSKYIELQTKDWIKQRNEKGYCYGLLEKDKIVMTKWMQKFGIRAPKVHYYNYHNEFKFDHLLNVAKNNPDQKFIIKISHLQSNYGIIILPAYNTQKNDDYLYKIYDKCLEKFKTCFVCNHDKNTAPTKNEISKGLKESHYKLYETIEPGIIIQEFFYSKENDKNSAPEELKILVYGNKIIEGLKEKDYERYKPAYDMARKVSNLLGSSLIRVDVFFKESDNPCVPYLNEISLSPNGGFKTKYYKEEYGKEIKNLKPINMEIDELIKSCPKRSIPIEKYLSDNDWSIWWNDKYRFGLLK